MDLNQPSEITPAQPTLEQLLQLLEQPAVCARLQQMVSEGQNRQTSRWQRVSAFVAGASSTLVVLLAFLIPSLQEQWNQYQSRRVLERHVELGRAFMREGKYALAEKSFAKAFELSESKRLDIEEERLKAANSIEAARTDYLDLSKELKEKEEPALLQEVWLSAARAEEALVGLPSADGKKESRGEADKVIEYYEKAASIFPDSDGSKRYAAQAKKLKENKAEFVAAQTAFYSDPPPPKSLFPKETPPIPEPQIPPK